jgi:pilus assembly protein Flp/PilA
MGHYLREDRGGSAAEYALILAIIGVAIAASVLLLGNAVASAMNNSSALIASSTSGGAPRNPNACAGCNSGNGNTTPGNGVTHPGG